MAFNHWLCWRAPQSRRFPEFLMRFASIQRPDESPDALPAGMREDISRLREAVARVREGSDPAAIVDATRQLKRISSMYGEQWIGAEGDPLTKDGARLRNALSSQPVSLSFSADGSILVTVSSLGEVRISDLAIKSLPGKLELLPAGGAINSAACSSDGRSLAVARDGLLYLHDLRSLGSAPAAFRPDFRSTFNGVAFFDSERIVACRTEWYGGTRGDSFVDLLEPVTVKGTRKLQSTSSHQGRYGDVMSDPFVSSAGTIWAVEGRSLKEIAPTSGIGSLFGLSGSNEPIHHFSTSKLLRDKDPRFAGARSEECLVCGLLPASEIDVVRVTGGLSKSGTARIGLPIEAKVLAMSDDAQRIAAADFRGRIVILDVSNVLRGGAPATLAIREADERVVKLAFSPCSKKLAAGTVSGDLILYQFE